MQAGQAKPSKDSTMQTGQGKAEQGRPSKDSTMQTGQGRAGRQGRPSKDSTMQAGQGSAMQGIASRTLQQRPSLPACWPQ